MSKADVCTLDVTLATTKAADEAFLWEMLVQAARMPADDPDSATTARQQPFLAKFVREWGTRPGDIGVIAREAAGTPLGAAWLRHFTGPDQSYPTVDCRYPEMAIAVQPAHTGRGIGTALLGRLLTLAWQAPYPGVMLSVRAGNPAVRLYTRHGFHVVEETTNWVGTRSLVMTRRLVMDDE